MYFSIKFDNMTCSQATTQTMKPNLVDYAEINKSVITHVHDQ